MKKKLNKVTQKRGGARTPKKLSDAQAILLKYIWENLGGLTTVAEKLHIEPQLLINWRLRGQVPLVMVGRIAREFGLDEYCLNFTDVNYFYGTTKDWNETVDKVARQLNFSSMQINKVKKANAPLW